MHPPVFDAHCHLGAEHLSRAVVQGLDGLVCAGVTPDGVADQLRTVERLRDWGCVAGATAGLHPWAVPDDARALRRALDRLSVVLTDTAAEIVAVGETGLDRVRTKSETHWALQQQALEEQLELARQHERPVVLHVVGAHTDCMRSLKRVGVPRAGLQVHGFWGSKELVDAWCRLGAHLSIGPAVVLRKGAKRAAALVSIPDDRLLVESDALPEAPHTPPHEVWAVIQALAAIRAQTESHVAVRSAENARRLFGLDKDLATPC